MGINIERVKELIQEATQYLSEAELLEENGWTEEDIELLEYITHNEFDITFK